MEKPIIDFIYIKEGEQQGNLSITANDKEIAIITHAKNGWTTSWQENTYSKIEELCKKLYPKGYIFPYYIDGAGYIRKKQ